MKYRSDDGADGVCLFIASTSFGSSLWKAPSRVCWTQQEDFHWYHCHLEQAQNNKAGLCLADCIPEVPRQELWLLVFGPSGGAGAGAVPIPVLGQALSPPCRDMDRQLCHEWNCSQAPFKWALTRTSLGFSFCRIFSFSNNWFAGVWAFIEVHDPEYKVQQFLSFLTQLKLLINPL